MHFRKLALASVACIALAVPAFSSPAKATIIHNSKGEAIGSVTVGKAPEGVLLTIEINEGGLPRGMHSVHIHEKGSCEAHDDEGHFTASGGHLNPDGVPHGYLSEGGSHPGDLPNISIAADGSGWMQTYNTLVSLDVTEDGKAALLDEDGSALIIHENPDDYKTQPTGGGGARLACGVIGAE